MVFSFGPFDPLDPSIAENAALTLDEVNRLESKEKEGNSTQQKQQWNVRQEELARMVVNAGHLHVSLGVKNHGLYWTMQHASSRRNRKSTDMLFFGGRLINTWARRKINGNKRGRNH